MAKSTKATKTTDSVESATNTPVVEQQTAPKTAKKAVKKTEAPTTTPVTASVVASPVAPAEEVHEAVEVSELDTQSNEFVSKLNQLSSLIASLKNEYKNLKTKWSRELKVAQKTSSKKKRKTGTRQPSGFVKPTRISDELASFLGKDKGTEMARTDVTREINKYIRSHNLQDKENGRKINPDTKLQTLLKLKKTDELTYFNLQKYMSHHFPKTEKPVVATA
uniref:DM2 domain-containing protein n=1 Tax=viral metagenome TaxID=1070528 RepID=A0A6C0IW67_9ZZZZ